MPALYHCLWTCVLPDNSLSWRSAHCPAAVVLHRQDPQERCGPPWGQGLSVPIPRCHRRGQAAAAAAGRARLRGRDLRAGRTGPPGLPLLCSPWGSTAGTRGWIGLLSSCRNLILTNHHLFFGSVPSVILGDGWGVGLTRCH